jgi:murein DD-endopeptidase MepM/ murein hydrolase activator NlpD
MKPFSMLTTKAVAAILLAAAVTAPGMRRRVVDIPGSVTPAGSVIPARSAPPALPRYELPLAGRVVIRTPFSPPSVKYRAGHLGVDLAASLDEPVRAASAGTVTFAGQVAGRGVVVITHPGGIRTEYEPLAVLVRTGRLVGGGELIGRVHGAHPACGPALCLHWGARRASTYLDPMSLLRLPLGAVRLLPWAASGDRPP